MRSGFDALSPHNLGSDGLFASSLFPPEDRAPTGSARQTVTVMLKNLPNRAKANRVKQHIQSIGFPGFSTVNLPIDRKTGCNKGYCFIGFPDKAMANDFITKVSETQLA